MQQGVPPIPFFPAVLLDRETSTRTNVTVAFPVTAPLEIEGFALEPAADDAAERIRLTPVLSYRFRAALAQHLVGEHVVDPEAQERRRAAFSSAIGATTAPPRNPLASRCRKRVVCTGLIDLACAFGLASVDATSLVFDSLSDTRDIDRAWLLEIDRDVRENGSIYEWDVHGRELDRVADEARAAAEAASAAKKAREEAHRAREMRPNKEALSDLGVDACFKVLRSHAHQLDALGFGAAFEIGSKSRFPADAEAFYVLVANDGYTFDAAERILPGVSSVSLDTVLQLPVATMRGRMRAPDLMTSLRAEKLDRRPMAEADFLDPESPLGQHNLERWREVSRPSIKAAIHALGHPSFMMTTCPMMRMLDSGIRGRKLPPDVVVAAALEEGIDLWTTKIYPKPADWEERQRQRNKHETWEEEHPIPQSWNEAKLMRRCHAIVDGQEAHSSPGEFVEAPEPRTLDRLIAATKKDEWREPITRFVADRGVVRSDEIVAFLRSELLLEGEDTASKHWRIAAIMRDASFEKKNALVDGRRCKCWVRVEQRPAGIVHAAAAAVASVMGTIS